VERADDGTRFRFALTDARRPNRVFASGRGRLRDADPVPGGAP
jgi:hypothetical protein